MKTANASLDRYTLEQPRRGRGHCCAGLRGSCTCQSLGNCPEAASCSRAAEDYVSGHFMEQAQAAEPEID